MYIRKYHILNMVGDIVQKNHIQISYHDRDKILRIFALINQVLSQVNGDRKRMISVKFILRQIFRNLVIEYKCIPLSKSKKTLKFYNICWKQIYILIKDDICVILRKEE